MSSSLSSDSTRAQRRKNEDFGNTSALKKAKKICSCIHISPQNCQTCAKIARKIYRLFGKRLALSDAELSAKPPPKSSQSDGRLVFADEPCSCPSEKADGCTTCTNSAIKMGIFVKIYSHKEGLQDTVTPKYPADCDCDYVSNVGCTSCAAVIDRIQRIFTKKVYLTLHPSPAAVPEANLRKHLLSAATAVDLVPSSPHSFPPALVHYVALDCEMVGVMDYTQKNAKGRPKMVNALARCSIVDAGCNVLLDIYVKPDRPIADYRTKYSGITKTDMRKAVSTSVARRRITDMLKDKIVVGHTLDSDFNAVGYSPDASQCRDIAKCKALRDMYLHKSGLSGPGLQKIGLKRLSAVLLNSLIQTGGHCSVEDAIHTMKLFLLVKDMWELSDDQSDELTHAATGSISQGKVLLSNEN